MLRAPGEPPRYRFDGGHLELFVFARWNILPVVREVAAKIVPVAAPQVADGRGAGAVPRAVESLPSPL